MDELIRAVTVAETPEQMVTAVKNLSAATASSATASSATAASASAGAAAAPSAAPAGGAAPAQAAADERFTVRFRAPDPDVDAIRVTCKGGLSAQGTREVKLTDVPAVACQVTVRRGPQSSAASVIVSGSRTYECFTAGSAVCR